MVERRHLDSRSLDESPNAERERQYPMLENGVSLGTICEYKKDDWTWVIVTDLKEQPGREYDGMDFDTDEPLVRFLILDKLTDDQFALFEDCVGCYEHVDTARMFKDVDGAAGHFAPRSYFVETFRPMGPMHPDHDEDEELAADGGQDVEQAKEAHRLGTINRWDAPDADWAADHDWTRYRGPQPYPVPEDWALDTPESDAVGWFRFPDVGDGHGTTDDVYDALDDDLDAIEEARGERAFLINDIVEHSRSGPTIVEHELSIDGETVFRRVDPTDDELWARVADALARYADGEDVAEIAEDIGFQSGRLPDDVAEEQEQERRREENESLDEFATDGGEPRGNQIECKDCGTVIDNYRYTRKFGVWDAERQNYDHPPGLEYHYCEDCWRDDYGRQNGAHFRPASAQHLYDVLDAADGDLAGILTWWSGRPAIRVVDGEVEAAVTKPRRGGTTEDGTPILKFECERIEGYDREQFDEDADPPEDMNLVLLRDPEETPFVGVDGGDADAE